MTKIFPRLQELADFGFSDGQSLDELNKLAGEFFEFEATETEKFIATRPEYFPSQKNAKLIEAWMYLHNDALFTFYNLQIACDDLLSDGLLEQAPPPEPVTVDKWAGVTLARTDALAEYVPSDQESKQLAKVADDPTKSDHVRKDRDRRLALLAGQQRRALAAESR